MIAPNIFFHHQPGIFEAVGQHYKGFSGRHEDVILTPEIVGGVFGGECMAYQDIAVVEPVGQRYGEQPVPGRGQMQVYQRADQRVIGTGRQAFVPVVRRLTRREFVVVIAEPFKNMIDMRGALWLVIGDEMFQMGIAMQRYDMDDSVGHGGIGKIFHAAVLCTNGNGSVKYFLSALSKDIAVIAECL